MGRLRRAFGGWVEYAREDVVQRPLEDGRKRKTGMRIATSAMSISYRTIYLARNRYVLEAGRF